jgi:hypothetical protein
VVPEPETANETENEEPAPSETELTPPPAARTRKAKDTQMRLGKGRPAIAGGNGARAVTKSASMPRGSTRGRASRISSKPAQETILEGETYRRFDRM